MNKWCARQAAVTVGLACGIAAGCHTGQRPPVTTVPSAPIVAAAQAAWDIDATTLDGKLMFGYQGWFGCPGDGSPLAAWEHWFRRGTASVSTLRVDMWPDVSELPDDERCGTPLVLPDGRPAQLYSAYNR